MIKNKLLTPIFCLAASTSIVPILTSVSCNNDQESIQTYKCVSSTEYDGYIPSECLTGNKIKLNKNKKYKFTIANIKGGQEGINASLFALITDWKGGDPTYYDLQTNEIISVKHNDVDETTKIKKEDEYFILNNDEGYSSGKLEITIKLSNDVECIPNFEDA